MMKIILIALFFSVAFAQLNCNATTTTCLKAAGDQCGFANGNNAVCDYGLACNYQVSPTVCAAIPALGEACTLGQQCQAGTCQGGVCRLTTTAGHACSADTDCTFQSGADTNSTCVNGVCYGLGLDASCGFGQCNAGLYCNAFFAGKCVAQLTQGGDCSATGLGFFACAAGFSCIAGVCEEAVSGEVGDTCTSNINCAEGNFCATSSTPNTCQAGFVASGNDCSATSDCEPNEVCGCTAVGGTGVCKAPVVNAVGLRAAYLNFQRCIYNASAACNQFIPTGCPECQTQYCAYVPYVFPSPLTCGYSAEAKALVNGCVPTVPPTLAPTVPPTIAPTTPAKDTTTTTSTGAASGKATTTTTGASKASTSTTGGGNAGVSTTTSGAISVVASIAMVVIAMMSLFLY